MTAEQPQAAAHHWFELALRVPEEAVEPVSDALEALDALSVSLEDADAHTPAEQALFGEPGMAVERHAWQRSRLTALFTTRSAAESALALLQAQDFFAGCVVVAVQAVPETDWVRLTQAQFAPVHIAHGLWVVPSWHEPPSDARHVIRLDPGLAFGTGTHATTRMCLRWLAERPTVPARVLDYGCGSGILAIGAALLGASDIVAVDIDAAALEATALNARNNDVQVRCGAPELAQGCFDVVLANILAIPLQVLAPLLCAHVATGGHLVLAGILERQTQELQAAYAPWLELQVADRDDGWVLMTATRPA